MDNELRIAILIDADNVSDKYIKIIVDEVANIGIAPTNGSMETGPVHGFPPGKRFFWRIPSSYPAVQLYHRKKRHRFGDDH